MSESPAAGAPSAGGSTAVPSPAVHPPAGYERLVQQLIPGYASLARLGVALLSVSPLARAPGASVLVAGCGTGAELLEARAQRPDWQLTALDPSASMLAVARRRLEGMGPIQWCQCTVEDLEAREAFDAVLSVLVLQSLPDDGGKLAFLSALAGCLRPGGQAVLVDLMRPERSALQEQLEAARSAFQQASGLAGMPLAGTGEEDPLAASLLQGLHPIGTSRLTSLVNAAGFSDPAPVFRALDVEGFLLQRRS